VTDGSSWWGAWWPVPALFVLAGLLVLITVRRDRVPGRGRTHWLAALGAVIALLLAAGFVGFSADTPDLADVDSSSWQ